MAIHEAWIFDDDSVLVKFQNGCLLQLSSCGAVFRSFTQSDKVTSRNICHSDQVQQYSHFATTMWKDMVRQAVDFRNKFASYPYMCHNLSEILPPAEVGIFTCPDEFLFIIHQNHSEIIRIRLVTRPKTPQTCYKLFRLVASCQQVGTNFHQVPTNLLKSGLLRHLHTYYDLQQVCE